MFGLFFNSFLNFFGVHAGYLTATLSGLIPIVVVGFMTQKDIRLSAKLVGLFITIEAGFVALLCLYILIKQQCRSPVLAAAQPAAATRLDRFLNALLFAVLAIAAFDIVRRWPRRPGARARWSEGDHLRHGRGRALLGLHLVRHRELRPPARWPLRQLRQFTPIYLVAGHYVSWLRILVR